MGYRCTCCGNQHDDLPDLVCPYPDPFRDVPESERAARTETTSDTCIVRNEEDTFHFIRGMILIPVVDWERCFGFGVWVSQSSDNFRRYVANEVMSPTFGWLCNRLPIFEESTYALKTQVNFTNDGNRPTIELEATEHPLAVYQRNGITFAEALKLVHQFLPN